MPGITIGGAEVSAVTIDGTDVKEITVDGTKVWPLLIEDFEDISSYDETYRGTFTGDSSITSNAALVSNSTQGLRCSGFVEMYTLAGDQDPELTSGEEHSFYFRPVSYDSDDQWHFMISPQSSASHPPDYCYRLEFHMDGGSRITKISGGNRDVLATENQSSWSSSVYKVTVTPSSSGITMSANGQTLSSSDTEYIQSGMGHGWRASGGGTVDYDWLGFE